MSGAANKICRLFGHKARGYFDRAPYLTVPAHVWEGHVWRDGTGRGHADLRAECDRCGEKYTAARIHIPFDVLNDERAIAKATSLRPVGDA